jgi:thermospermine synthase
MEAQSAFQAVEVINTSTYGKMLMLDKQVQSSSMDEFIYHESLVHPTLLSLPVAAKRVFIGGGGEGATAREVLRHSSVTECIMADIDPVVCQAAKDHLQQWHQGAFEDPRMTLIIDDAKKILESYPDGYFDAIILDLSDPLDYGPCYTLYSTEFYTICVQKLATNGVFVTQAGPASVHACTDCFTAIHTTLQQVFPFVFADATHIPSFTNLWGFHLALKTAEGNSFVQNSDKNALLAERLSDASLLRHYDSDTHQSMFMLPKYIRTHLKAEERVICEATPIFVSHVKCDIVQPSAPTKLNENSTV